MTPKNVLRKTLVIAALFAGAYFIGSIYVLVLATS